MTPLIHSRFAPMPSQPVQMEPVHRYASCKADPLPHGLIQNLLFKGNMDMKAQGGLGEIDQLVSNPDLAALIRMSARQRFIGIGLSALLLCGGMPQSVSAKPDAQDGVGQIVQPATGTDRAVYAPLDRPVILPRFLGNWATRPGKCIGQSYKNRMGLRPDLAIIAGQALTVREAYVDAGPPRDRAGDEPLPVDDYANARDMLIRVVRSGEDTSRAIHFQFSSSSGRLIVEEVGKPRRAYVRCSL